MIAFLTGIVKALGGQSITVLTEQIGLELFVPSSSSFAIDQKISLHVHLHWSQDQGPALFGFKTAEEKLVFLAAIKCPGVGPKLALVALEHLGATHFVQAIAQEDEQALSSVPGIGKKKAEQIIVQLKHPVAKLLQENHGLGVSGSLADLQKISEVLHSLNYSRTEVNNALELLKKEKMQDESSFEVLLRKALSHLTKRV